MIIFYTKKNTFVTEKFSKQTRKMEKSIAVGSVFWVIWVDTSRRHGVA